MALQLRVRKGGLRGGGVVGGGRDLFLPEPNLARDVKAGRRCSASLCNIIPR